MAADDTTQKVKREPVGFGEHTRGLAGEYAHEQGWGLDVEERTKQPDTPQDIDGGTDYEYGARDFGDTPVNTANSVAFSNDEVEGETSGEGPAAGEGKQGAR